MSLVPHYIQKTCVNCNKVYMHPEGNPPTSHCSTKCYNEYIEKIRQEGKARLRGKVFDVCGQELEEDDYIAYAIKYHYHPDLRIGRILSVKKDGDDVSIKVCSIRRGHDGKPTNPMISTIHHPERLVLISNWALNREWKKALGGKID
jgi:hypothetical protein